MKESIAGLITIILLSATMPAQLLTPEAVVEIKKVDEVVIQPQGNYIAYSLQIARGEDDSPGSAYKELWVVPVKAGDAKRYVAAPVAVKSLQWSSDGKLITFLAKRKAFDKYTQVYGIPVGGGEARLLTHAPASISEYSLSPDDNQIAYIVEDEKPAEIKAAEAQGFDQMVEDTWEAVNRIHIENLKSGETHLVTESNEHVWELSFTPDGKHIIYRASEQPFIDHKYMFTDNYIVSAAGGSGQKIYDTEGKLTLAKQSPNGSHFAWLGATSFNDPYTHSLFVLSKDGDTPKNLLGDFAGTGESFVWKDEQTILLVMIENTQKYLYEVSISDGKMKKLTDEDSPIIDKISLSVNKKLFATVANAHNHPDEVFLGTLNNKPLKRLTNSNPQLADVRFGEQETITWQGPDELSISGILVKPVDYESGKLYPLQVQVHGGPESARLDGWYTGYNRPIQMLAQRGVMVLIPNYRGSIGKGVAFAKGDHNDLMGKEFDDILAGLDYLVEQGMVDPQRVAIGGGSYGGYAAAWGATKHSERFAAAVMFVGISNQISKAGMTDTPVENAVVHWNQWLYDDFDFTWDRSPLKYINSAKTPTLILHGEDDKRVPLNQAYEMYRGLKFFNVPTELVVYPREGHGNKERAHQIDLSRRVLEWYLKYLKSEPTAIN